MPVDMSDEWSVATQRGIQKLMLTASCLVLLSDTFYLISCRSSKPVIRPALNSRCSRLLDCGCSLHSGREQRLLNGHVHSSCVTLVVQGNGEHRVLQQDMDNLVHNSA